MNARHLAVEKGIVQCWTMPIPRPGGGCAAGGGAFAATRRVMRSFPRRSQGEDDCLQGCLARPKLGHLYLEVCSDAPMVPLPYREPARTTGALAAMGVAEYLLFWHDQNGTKIGLGSDEKPVTSRAHFHPVHVAGRLGLAKINTRTRRHVRALSPWQSLCAVIGTGGILVGSTG